MQITKGIFFLFLLLFVQIKSNQSSRRKISTMNVLLPICENFDCKPIYTNVDAEGGCYEWSVQNSDLIKLEQLPKRSDNKNCYSRAKISPLSKTVHESTYLIAREKLSGEIFKIKVGFAEVDKISIEKNFDVMSVDEILELHVQAHDSKGNLFSSLKGWKFNWSISQNQEKAELIKLTQNGGKKVGKTRTQIEKAHQSDVILIIGKLPGKVTVSVHLEENSHLNHLVSERELSINEPFEIVPKKMYMLVGSGYQFRLKLSKSGKFIENLDNYIWSLSIEGFGGIENGYYTTGERTGVVKLRAKDKRLGDTETWSEAEITVLSLPQVELDIGYKEFSKQTDFKRKHVFNLAESRTYTFKHFLIYANNIVHYNLTQGVSFKTHWEPIYPYLEGSKITCSEFNTECNVHVVASDPKEFHIDSSVMEFPNVKVNKIVYINEKLKILKYGMKIFTLPYLGETGQELYLNVIGGSGVYKFISSDESVVSVVGNDHLIGRAKGVANIRAVDVEYEDIEDNVDIQVVDVSSLSYFEERQEIELGNQFTITPIGVFENDKVLTVNSIFTNCTRLPTELQDNRDKVEEVFSNETFITQFDEFKKSFTNADLQLKFEMKKNKPSLIQNYLEYLDYANYGICGFKRYDTKKEGFVSFSYSYTIRGTKISTTSSTQVLIYSHLRFKNIIQDDFTEKLIKLGKIDHPDKKRTYIQAHNSILYLELEGGIQSWVGYESDFTRKIELLKKDEGKNYIVDFSFVSDKLKAACKSIDGQKEFLITIKNEPSKTLLKPATTEIIVKLGCYKPKHLGIYFISHEESPNPLMFEVPQRAGIEYFEKQNSTQPIRVYGFDSENRMIVTLAQITGNWFQVNSEKEKYFSVLSKSQYKSFQIDNEWTDEEFIQDYIKFGNYLKKFDLKYVLGKHIVEHYCTLTLIDYPILDPSEAVIYIREKNNFVMNIIGGSGNFNVTLGDQKLSEMDYDGKRKITIKPKMRGILYVHVIDRALSIEHRVTGTVYLADLEKIVLSGQRALLVGGKLNLNVTAFDTFGNQFKQSQLATLPMLLNDTLSSEGLDLALSEDKTLIYVTGKSSGKFTLNAFETNAYVTSNNIDIRVCNNLEIYPPYLLLVPGSSFTLRVTGYIGIEGVEYRMNNTKIAQVSNLTYPEVTGLELGTTNLEVYLRCGVEPNKIYKFEDEKENKNYETLFVTNVPVHVDFPNKVEIEYTKQNRVIYTGATVRLFALIKKDNDLFTYGTGPFQFKWNVDNKKFAKIFYVKGTESNILTTDINSDTGIVLTEEDPNPENSIGVFLKSSEKGMINVSLNVIITYPPKYKSKSPQHLTSNGKIEVNDEIYFNVPEFYETPKKKTGLYLIPFDVDHELNTNKNITKSYSVVRVDDSSKNFNETVISLTDYGLVTTYNKTGVTFVKVSMKENQDNINDKVPVVLPIFVTEFYSIFVEKSNRLFNLEISQAVSLKIVIQHYSGLIFAEKFERLPLQIVESHPKVAKGELQDSNSKLEIKAYSIGETNIILFHPITREIYDVFKVRVTSQGGHMDKILLNLGGTIEFNDKIKKELSTKYSRYLKWVSDAPEVVRVDGNVAQGIKEGTANIKLKGEDGTTTKLSILIEVNKIAKVELDRAYLPNSLSDVISSTNPRQRSIPILITNDRGEEFTKNDAKNFYTINNNINLNCDSDDRDIVIAEGKNTQNEKECLVTVREGKYSGKSKSKNNVKLILALKTTSGPNKYTIKNSQDVSFTSSFKIKNDIHDVKLSFANREYRLYIDSLDDLIVTYDKNVMEVSKNENEKYFLIKVPNHITTEFENSKIRIEHILSKQVREISVTFSSPKGGKLFFGLISTEAFTDFLTMILLIVIVVILIFHVSSGKSNDGYRGNPNRATYSNTPISGPKGSTAGRNNHFLNMNQ